MIIRDRARTLRKVIEGMAAGLTDKQALESKELFPSWSADGAYQTGDRVRYDGILYKCLIAHTSQSDWIPSDAVSKVKHLNRTWVSDIDNNVLEPSVYGWSEVI